MSKIEVHVSGDGNAVVLQVEASDGWLRAHRITPDEAKFIAGSLVVCALQVEAEHPEATKPCSLYTPRSWSPLRLTPEDDRCVCGHLKESHADGA